MIWLGVLFLLAGLFMCSQNTWTVVGGPLATIGAAVLVVGLLS